MCLIPHMHLHQLLGAGRVRLVASVELDPSTLETMNIGTVASTRWDAIVIGTGLGGAHAGARLVQAGMKVLFVERATQPANDGEPAPLEQLEAEVTIDGGFARRVPTSISAVGGTSVVYAASLELPARHDLDDMDDIPHPTGG